MNYGLVNPETGEEHPELFPEMSQALTVRRALGLYGWHITWKDNDEF